ncbi:hypothetical protein B1759_15095 [Rubrivirga sp. SAORIC476]|uniref:hypothetical protein n=1 Tax=Rubrivirga sp. SAORIC476 TaxID=1961794 RepID=UPI000BA970BA|nr:hypothetical protein [Rubrivirga sp. SAORIC476]PAP79643.1 hypothetical protein B1759_15095 [Rubrivirga sp. SAORIC476]
MRRLLQHLALLLFADPPRPSAPYADRDRHGYLDARDYRVDVSGIVAGPRPAGRREGAWRLVSPPPRPASVRRADVWPAGAAR